MHADELEVGLDMVARLLAGQFPEWADRPLRPVPSAGTDNALFRLGGDMVVRLPRIGWAVADVEKEHRWLPRLGPALPVAVPRPLGLGAPAEGYPWPWSVYAWLAGDNPVVGRLPDPLRFAADLAGFLGALRAVDAAGGPPARRGVPLADRDAATRAAIDALGARVDGAAVAATWSAALQAPAWTGSPTWVHGDLAPGNLLCTSGSLAGVLDFSGLGVGDPACDLMVAWNLLPSEARRVFRSALGVDDAEWERGRGWALSVALIQLPYYWDTNPALAGSARHVIGQVLADVAG